MIRKVAKGGFDLLMYVIVEMMCYWAGLHCRIRGKEASEMSTLEVWIGGVLGFFIIAGSLLLPFIILGLVLM